jgi:hypothetical protein
MTFPKLVANVDVLTEALVISGVLSPALYSSIDVIK